MNHCYQTFPLSEHELIRDEMEVTVGHDYSWAIMYDYSELNQTVEHGTDGTMKLVEKYLNDDQISEVVEMFKKENNSEQRYEGWWNDYE